MKKLLVASIYTPISYNNNWLDTQLKFFNLTTKDYDFGVFCNSIDPKFFENDAIVLGYQGPKELGEHWSNQEYMPEDEELDKSYRKYHYDMRVAYFKIMDYFREHADEYENFLMCDCDIFPVHPQWQQILDHRLETTNRWYSSLLRGENFETYPWLGMFYIKGEHIHEDIPDWFPREYENSFGEVYREFGAGRNKTHHNGESIWYPLIRSNVVNLHPVRFGIYNHLFYHHLKGSWNKDDIHLKPELTKFAKFELRGYYDHYIPRESHPKIAQHCHARLMQEPEKFICSLMGVDPDEWFNQKELRYEENSIV